jgi:esterase/lipase superfamily enzyme
MKIELCNQRPNDVSMNEIPPGRMAVVTKYTGGWQPGTIVMRPQHPVDKIFALAGGYDNANGSTRVRVLEPGESFTVTI